ncbi:PilZ domain-containing protein [Synechococcus sp. CCY 9618]|uniref:PilZ domain-containing protein n=1 Tax=Synechococcus sp. CCY 9618 TaxID=2815602 RepID=UPI001C241800
MGTDKLRPDPVTCCVPEAVPEDVPAPESNAEDRRASVRHVLPAGVSASMRTLSGRIVHVSVTDISRAGVCVIRRGGIDVAAAEEVTVEFSDAERQQKLSLPSRVEWVKPTAYNSQIGLRFLQGPLLPGTMLDEYLDQSLTIRSAPK